MIKNILRTAYRSLKKNAFYSVVNLWGLALGISLFLLVGAYVWRERQVNQHLPNLSNQYIIQSTWGLAGTYDLTTVGALAKAMKERYPALVENYYRWDGITATVSLGDKHLHQSVQIGDTTLFSMYRFPLVFGDPGNLWPDSRSMVLTQKTALRFFGRADVVGRSLVIESFSGSREPFHITGVLAEVPPNSVTSIDENNRQDLFLPETAISFFGRNIESWANPWIVGYLELRPGVNPRNLEPLMQSMVSRLAPLGISDQMHPTLVSLRDYYLDANQGLVRKMLRTLLMVGLAILGMAIINYLNISVSRASHRMREVGVRKVMGGTRLQLTTQFLAESFVLVGLATGLGCLGYFLGKPFFNGMLNTQLPSWSELPGTTVGWLSLFVLSVGLMAGIYPALVMSGIATIPALKAKHMPRRENLILRKVLICLQFSTTLLVLLWATYISRQVNFCLHSKLGYDKEFVLAAQTPRDWTPQGVERMETIRETLSRIPKVEDVSLSYELPNGNNGDVPNVFKMGEDSTRAQSMQQFSADRYYAGTYGLKMAAGKFFEPGPESGDSTQMVLNETAARSLGFQDPAEALGAQLKIQGKGSTVFSVVGIIRDFHYQSMQGKILSCIFVSPRFANQYRFLSFRMQPQSLSSGVQELEKQWKVLLPGVPFDYVFLDQVVQSLYSRELQLQKAALLATVLSSVMALMGVLGLVALSLEKRSKEISVRRVLGSSALQVVWLFVREFLPLLFLSAALAFPLAAVLIVQWLNGYAYRIPLSAGPFIWALTALAGLTVLLIALQTIRQASRNPAQNLRSE